MIAAGTRFWSKVDRSKPVGCWPWLAASDKDGYGFFKVTHRLGVYQQTRAHRYSLEMALGRKLEPGEMALHHCDNPPCVNPDHLYIGTISDNTRDAVGRGRPRRGVENAASKLTVADVLAIRAWYAAGGTRQQDIAARFGVSQGAVGRIVLGRTWTHVGGQRTAFGRGRNR